MQILNIGPLELIIVLLIMFLLLGPKEMILTAQRIGKWIRGFVRSPMWKEIMGYSQEIRELPQKIMDDTGLKETLDDIKSTTTQTAQELNSTVREAVKDARVPEAENIRIDTNPSSVPTGAPRQTYPTPIGQAAVDAAKAAVKEVSPAVVDTAVTSETEAAAAAAEIAAVSGTAVEGAALVVAEEAPKPRRTRAKKIEEGTAEETPAPRARRTRKTTEAAAPEAPAVMADSAPEAAAATELETAAPVAETLSPAAVLADRAPVEPPTPARKPRARKPKLETSPVEDLPVREPLPEPVAVVETAVEAPAAPVRRTRKKAAAAVTPLEPAPVETMLPASAAVEQAAQLVDTVLPGENGAQRESAVVSSEGTAFPAAEEPAPVRKPRRTRKAAGNAAVYEAPGEPAPADNDAG